MTFAIPLGAYISNALVPNHLATYLPKFDRYSFFHVAAYQFLRIDDDNDMAELRSGSLAK